MEKKEKIATIEQLAPYLPYEVKCRMASKWALDHKLIGLEYRPRLYSKAVGFFDYGGTVESIGLSMFRVLLIPMAKLTREELEQAGFEDHIDFLTYELQNYVNQGRGTMLNRVLEAPAAMVQWLASKHYDYQDLIGQGLALVKD